MPEKLRAQGTIHKEAVRNSSPLKASIVRGVDGIPILTIKKSGEAGTVVPLGALDVTDALDSTPKRGSRYNPNLDRRIGIMADGETYTQETTGTSVPPGDKDTESVKGK